MVCLWTWLGNGYLRTHWSAFSAVNSCVRSHTHLHTDKHPRYVSFRFHCFRQTQPHEPISLNNSNYTTAQSISFSLSFMPPLFPTSAPRCWKCVIRWGGGGGGGVRVGRGVRDEHMSVMVQWGALQASTEWDCVFLMFYFKKWWKITVESSIMTFHLGAGGRTKGMCREDEKKRGNIVVERAKCRQVLNEVLLTASVDVMWNYLNGCLLSSPPWALNWNTFIHVFGPVSPCGWLSCLFFC